MKTKTDLKLLYKQETGKDCVTHIPNTEFTDYEQDFEYYEWVEGKLLELMNAGSIPVRTPQSVLTDQLDVLGRFRVGNPGR
jgi:hypothetical protein